MLKTELQSSVQKPMSKQGNDPRRRGVAELVWFYFELALEFWKKCFALVGKRPW